MIQISTFKVGLFLLLFFSGPFRVLNFLLFCWAYGFFFFNYVYISWNLVYGEALRPLELFHSEKTVFSSH